MSRMEPEETGADIKTPDAIARQGSTGTTKHGRHGRAQSDWATVAKAVKEPAYRGPWVSSKQDVVCVQRNAA